MTEAIAALERATARLAGCDESRMEEMAEAAAARAAAAALLAGVRLEGGDAERVRASIEAGEAVMTRIRGWRSAWREELDSAEQARRYGEALTRSSAAPGCRIDVAG